MNDLGFFAKVRARRTVFKRTKANADVPELALYLEWLSRDGKRKVLDRDGKEHVLTDTVMQSYFKVVSKGDAKKLIDKHWADQITAPQSPVRKEA